MLTGQQALGQGYTIDNHGPGRPVAYKGARFNPQTALPILTDLEAELLAALKMAERAFNQDEIDPLVAFATIEKMRAAIAKAETT